MADDNAAPACHGGKNAVHGYQLPWMSPWQTSYKRAKPACNPARVGCESKEVKEGNYAKQHDLIGGLKFNGRWSLQREERSDYEDDRESGTGPCIRDGNGRRKRARHHLPSKSACNALPKTETSVKGRHLPSKSAPNAPETETSVKGHLFLSPLVQMKSPRAVEQKDLPVSTPVWNDYRKSPSDFVPINRRDKGKTVMPQFKGGPHEVCPTNESSAKTEAMVINDLHENNLPGEGPSQPYQCFKDSQNALMSPVATTMAKGNTIAKSVNTAPLNKESDEPLTVVSPVDDRETSQSRTHSLDAEQLFSDVDGHARPDPSSRWVKRLKLCTLDAAHGTKNENIGEASSREKENNISRKVMEDSKASLEAKVVCHAEEKMVSYPPATVLPHDESYFTEAKKTVDVTLSHPWIQRWINNRSAFSRKRHESAELHEPKYSKLEFQKKQSPSIAALAMVGKAINNLNPPEHTRKGHVMVWNTKGL